ncbi:3-hydroxybutyryl-CoA dehydrogenase [Falsigemmobacter faecalis]|uniref:3-hydroxybutyryl-CoA dehydrogenase n=2 Tax=Falsigemmobacter faecalis TaxID=2488730 RepID=A0A3P3D9M8_9RHOB|nr:3-hydroxybutyryl-CoA dehydrogenase [Falsigemmobacter faecalis]
MRRYVVLLGAGVMGQGLARHFHRAGFQVAVVDPNAEALEKLQKSLPELTIAQDLAALSANWASADLVIEAVPEILSLKTELLARAEAFFSAQVLIASNTSGLTTADLCRNMRHPERLAIAHFFNPADVIPVVELVASAQMPRERLEQLTELLRGSGKEPAVLHREVPGFVANRIQHAMMRECLHLLDQGVADAETIDSIVRWSLGVRLAFTGPFGQRDLNGLDTHLNIAGYLYPDLSAAQTPSATLQAKVAEGALGRKSGAGFYAWDQATQARAQAAEAALDALILQESQGASSAAQQGGQN